jgi:FkbM family methyltransferase
MIQQNVDAASAQLDIAPIELHQAALGSETGTAQLHIPPGFSSNDGIARIDPNVAPGGDSMTVRVDTLDRVLGTESVSLLKLDVEGFEPDVLRGSVSALAQHRIKHIVFEDHAATQSEVVPALRRAGYHLFSLGWSMRGLGIQPIEAGTLATAYEAPSYIATIAPSEVYARCRPLGWLVFRRDLGRR